MASADKFSRCQLVQTTADGKEYSWAVQGGCGVTNEGAKVAEVIDASVFMLYVKVQMCDGLCERAFVASVSRPNQAGHRLTCFVEEFDSYIECKATGVQRWF